jgi:hypothetical protein
VKGPAPQAEGQLNNPMRRKKARILMSIDINMILYEIKGYKKG